VVKDGASNIDACGNLAGLGSGDIARVGFELGFFNGSADHIDRKELTIFLVATELIPDAFGNWTVVTLFSRVDDSITAKSLID